MTEAGDHGERAAKWGKDFPRILLLAGFGAATFLAGRLWSLREVKEAQRQAGLAEESRIRLQAELVAWRNAALLRTEPALAGDDMRGTAGGDLQGGRPRAWPDR